MSAGGASFAYDGAGNRIRQTLGADVTRYLLDLQPGLALVLSQSTGANTERYVHSARGIHAKMDAGNSWDWLLQDGLGSVRSVTDNNTAVLWATGYSAYGEPIHSVGTAQTMYGFTGEATNGNGDVFLRARHYRPSLGIFPSLDPFEGIADRPMSLNGYSWVEGNVPNGTDASGRNVDRSNVEKGLAAYSCNCGWLDYRHAYPVHAYQVLTAVSHAFNTGLYTSNGTGMAFQYTAGADSGKYLQDNPPIAPGTALFANEPRLPWYYIPKHGVESRDLRALLIFLHLVSVIENTEARSSWPDAASSGNSVEDLPSYYLSFYLAKKMEQNGRYDEVFQARTDVSVLSGFMQSLAQEFLHECDICSTDASLDIWDNSNYTTTTKNLGFSPILFGEDPIVNRYCSSSAHRPPASIFQPTNLVGVPIDLIGNYEFLRSWGETMIVDRSHMDCNEVKGLEFFFYNGDIKLLECKPLTISQVIQRMSC